MGDLKLKKQCFRRRSSGQLLIIIPLSAAVIGAGIMTWYYFSQVRNQYNAQKIDVDVTSTLITIASRARRALAEPLVSNCFDPTLFQNYFVATDSSGNNVDPPKISFDLTNIPQCLLKQPDENPPGNPVFTQLAVTIARQGYPSLSDFSSRVRVDIQGQMAPRPGVIAKKINLSRNYVFRIATLNYFNVVFMRNNNLPYISIDPAQQGSVEFTGNVFFSDSNAVKLKDITPIDFGSSSTSGDPLIVFDRTVLFRSSQVQQDSSKTIDLLRFGNVFRQGFQKGVLPRMRFIPLPFDMFSTTQAWQQRTDYSQFNFNTGFFLPQLSGGETSVASVSDGTATPFAQSWTQNILPDSTAKVTKLSDTCANSNNSAMNPIFIFQQSDQPLTIDFNKDMNLNSNSSFPYSPTFCGLVTAKILKIITPSSGGDNFALFGNFIVERIVLTGSGNVFFYNPNDNITPVVSLPIVDATKQTLQTQLGISANLTNASSKAGNNFFAILFRDPTSGTLSLSQKNYLPRVPDNSSPLGWMQPCTSNNPSNNKYCTTPIDIDHSKLFKDPSNSDPGNDFLWIAESTL